MTRKNITRAILALGVVAAAVVSQVQQYDYDPAISVFLAVNGNDANPCTKTQPCRTQSRAENALNSLVGAGNRGNIIYLAGTYNTGITVRRSNTTVRAEALGDTIIRATGYNKGISVPDAAVGVWIEYLILEDASSHGYHITANNPPENPTILRRNIARYNVRENANGSLESMSCRGGNSNWGSAFKVAVGGRNIVLTGNQAYENCGEAYGITRGINVDMRYNVARDNFSVGFYIDNSNGVNLIHNHAYCTGNTRFYRGGDPQRGITLGAENYSGWGNQLGNVLIEFNFVSNCRGIRLYDDVPGTMGGLVIRNNWFEKSWDAIISVTKATLSNNVIGVPPQEWFDAFTSMPTPAPVTPTITRTPSPVPPTATRTPTSSPSPTPSVTPFVTVTPPVMPSETPAGTCFEDAEIIVCYWRKP